MSSGTRPGSRPAATGRLPSGPPQPVRHPLAWRQSPGPEEMPAERQSSRRKSSRDSRATLSSSSPAPSQLPLWGHNCPESPSAPTDLVSKEFPPILLDPEGLQSNSVNGGEAFQMHKVLRGLRGEARGAGGRPRSGGLGGRGGRSWGCARREWRPASFRDSCAAPWPPAAQGQRSRSGQFGSWPRHPPSPFRPSVPGRRWPQATHGRAGSRGGRCMPRFPLTTVPTAGALGPGWASSAFGAWGLGPGSELRPGQLLLVKSKGWKVLKVGAGALRLPVSAKRPAGASQWGAASPHRPPQPPG